MRRVQRLVEPVAQVVLPRCEAIRTSPYANDTDTTDRQCRWSAKFRIDGRNLCSKHAGPVALEILLRQGDAT